MFGLLRPRDPSKHERRDFQSAYCNLCGTLSHEYGVTTRFLVLYDFASLAWLFSRDDAKLPFVRLNCMKGGTRLRRQEPARVDRFLAAISVFTCGVKIRDDVADDGAVRARLSQAFYRKTFEKAEQDLRSVGFDVDAMHIVLREQQTLEESWERQLDIASAPTGKAYGMVARHLSQLSGATAWDEFGQIGEQIGRLVFLADAFRDVKQDAGRTYNPLTRPSPAASGEISSRDRQELMEYVVSCLERVELILADQDTALANRWLPLRRQLLALFGLKTSSVILNAQCCIPCGDCFVVVDSDECSQGFCVCCCFLACACAYFCN